MRLIHAYMHMLLQTLNPSFHYKYKSSYFKENVKAGLKRKHKDKKKYLWSRFISLSLNFCIPTENKALRKNSKMTMFPTLLNILDVKISDVLFSDTYFGNIAELNLCLRNTNKSDITSVKMIALLQWRWRDDSIGQPAHFSK